jgi:HEAT repeat protein
MLQRYFTTAALAVLVGSGTGVAQQRPDTLRPHLALPLAYGLAVSPTLTPALSLPVLSMGAPLMTTGLRPADEWFPQDTADALYRRGRAELNRGNFQAAIDLFNQLRRERENSSYVPQAMYYEAYALSRLRNEQSYRRGLDLLDEFRRRYGEADGSINREAEALYTQLQGYLARMGDSEAAALLSVRASQLGTAQTALQVNQVALQSQLIAQQAQQIALGTRLLGSVMVQGSDEDDVRMQALNALYQMDAENAVPILREVLANKDSSRVNMRKRALLILSQKRTDGREDILLDVARNDPDLGVREQAVQWLSMVRTDRAVAALDSILQFAAEESLQEKAILALSQHRSERAGEILRAYARRGDIPVDTRAQVIMWLGQRRSGENGAFLRELYPELGDSVLKERTLLALSQSRNDENAQFLMGIARDDNEDMRTRTRALFWVGQMRGVDLPIYDLYGQVTEPEMKEQLIAVYGQRGRDSVAVDMLIDIVRNEQDPELRGKAIFWLGQTRSPRAVEVLREIINNE